MKKEYKLCYKSELCQYYVMLLFENTTSIIFINN